MSEWEEAWNIVAEPERWARVQAAAAAAGTHIRRLATG
jgi:hypothetical protein